VAAAILSDSFGMTVGGTRMEKDSMGEMSVPESALYGASTQRAVLNFPVSGYRFSRPFIRALGLLKWAAAQANHDLGLLDAERSALIVQAAEEVIEGKLDEHFPLDIFQTGSGTSTNTNANEVIANRCAQLAGKPIGSREPVHPNDHVNMGQSSNDVIPSAIHISAAEQLKNSLVPALEKLQSALGAKTNEFWEIIKIGRTHLMDATPVRLGQEFSGYAQQVAYAKARAEKAIEVLRELALGGTAVGTGLNRHVDFPGKVMRHLEQRTGIAFFEAKNHFEAQGGKDAVVEASGQLKTIATSLFKIANDVRLLGSGPRCGIGEIQLPATQPGSSIMPGKVNPVMCESMMMVCAQVFGNDACVTWAGANGNFELNVMMPVMAHDFLESIRLLANVVDVFCDKCVTGIVANKKRCQELVELSMAMVTSLAPKIGYDRAAEIAKESAKTGKTVREICRDKKVMPEPELARVLDPVGMTEPGGEGYTGG
jgi:fumarate hydratase class II